MTGKVRTAIAVAGMGAALAASASAQGQVPGECDVCVDFVSTFDADRSGPAPRLTRMHEDLAPNVAYALDVDGALQPLVLGAAPAAPGYELRAVVEGLDAAKAKIRLEKLSTAPATMPLRVEIVRPDGAASRTLGYDTLETSAPGSFTAALDASNRDGRADTAQTKVDLTLAGSPERLAIVTERFAGDPAGTRTSRAIRRLELGGNGSATRVPGRASLDLTTSAASDTIALTRDVPTVATFELSEPDGTTRTTGTIDALPASARLELTGSDSDGDGRIDAKQLRYRASSVVGHLAIEARRQNLTAKASVRQLPSDVTLSLAAVPDGAAGRRTSISYLSNGRAAAARVELVKADAGETRELTVEATNLPARITELSYTTAGTGSKLDYVAGSRAARLEVLASTQTGTALQRLDASVDNLPARIAISRPVASGETHVSYVADAGADRAQAEFRSDPDVRVADTRDLTLSVTAERSAAVALPREIHIDAARSGDAKTFRYRASSRIPRLDVRGDNIEGLPNGARRLSALLRDVPVTLSFDTRDSATTTTREYVDCNPDKPNCNFDEFERQHPECDLDDIKSPPCPRLVPFPTSTETITTTASEVTVDAGLDRVGFAEIQMTSGPDVPLPENAPPRQGGVTPKQDGILVHDLADSYVAFVRLTQLRRAFVRKRFHSRRIRGGTTYGESSSGSHVQLLTNAGGNAFVIDQKDQEHGSDAIKSKRAFLANLPESVTVDLARHNSREALKYTANRAINGYVRPDGTPAPAFEEAVTRQQGTGPQVLLSRTTLDPMPRTLTVCKVSDDPSCSDGVFAAQLQRLRTGDPDQYRCFLDACGSGDDLPVHPDVANKGSVRITANPATKLTYTAGDTTLRLNPLTSFALQSHSQDYSCMSYSGPYTCKKGYIALDSNNTLLTGELTKSGTNDVRFTFPAGWKALRKVWGFHEMGYKSGEVGSVGSVRCPDPTVVEAGGKDLKRQFCFGQITDWETIPF